MGEGFDRHKKDWIAGGVTALTGVLLFLWLYFGSTGWSGADLASLSTPETGSDEVFIEPELLTAGEEESRVQTAPAEAPKGDPQAASKVEAKPKETVREKRAERRVEKEKSAEPKREPSVSEQERRQAREATAGAFAGKNGERSGPEGATGAGGRGAGVTGYAEGREFLSCPKPTVTLRNRTTVRVSVKVDAEGRVVYARAKSGGNASLRRSCEQAALMARWRAKPGAPTAAGTLTFTLLPR